MRQELVFRSKRNKVYYRDGLVVKVFADQSSADTEAAILRELRGAGLSVPAVLACCDNEIVMEYIEGEPLPDFLERLTAETAKTAKTAKTNAMTADDSGRRDVEPRVADRKDVELGDAKQKDAEQGAIERADAELCRAAKRLCEWFLRFYEAVDQAKSGEIRGDVNGRNFIITPDGVVGVDFEERVYGAVEQDIGRLLAFIRAYDLEPIRVKKRFARLFLLEVSKNLRLSVTEVMKRFKMELQAIKKRRQ